MFNEYPDFNRINVFLKKFIGNQVNFYFKIIIHVRKSCVIDANNSAPSNS